MEAAALAVGEGQLAAMREDDRAGDGEAEAGSAGLAAPRGLEPDEGLVDILDAVGRNSRAVVVDRDQRTVRGRGKPDAGTVAVADRILDEVADRTAERGRPARVRGGALRR